MTTRHPVRAFAAFLVFSLVFATSSLVSAQGMPIDSVLARIGSEIHNPSLAPLLRSVIPSYETQRVWGLSTGDFTNDTIPDIALSLYNTVGPKNQVRVYLIENVRNRNLVVRMSRSVNYVESPIEVGLSTEGSVVTIIQKTGDQHWFQEGYTIESGDVILVDRFETEKEDVTGDSKAKARSIGHETYRNYENLRTRESYFTGTTGDAMFTSRYYTIPAYQRLRDIYPGYGYILSDSSTEYVMQGSGMRRDASDLSIYKMQAAYDDDNLYLSLRVRDDYVIGGNTRPEANDRVTFWFDTKYTGDRLNRDRRLLSKQGGFPMFRDVADSLVSNISFSLPAQPGRISQIAYSSAAPLTSLQQEGLRAARGQMSFDTLNGLVNGYTLRLKIPFTFLGFELNPAKLYERRAPTLGNEEAESPALVNGTGEAATLGFTALIYDIDDASRIGETTVQATSDYREGNPSTFGTLILEPSTLYYGEVHPTYLDQVSAELRAAGF